MTTPRPGDPRTTTTPIEIVVGRQQVRRMLTSLIIAPVVVGTIAGILAIYFGPEGHR